MRRISIFFAIMSIGLIGVATPATAHPPANFPTTIALPDGFPPEGIAIGGHLAYFGSRLDGSIYRADLRTGTGAVLNRARVQPGQTVAVIGAGGIGQSVIQAARIAAAGRIVVIDANPAKEAVARQFGATDFIDGAAVDDVVAAVKALDLANGVDHAFECVGHPALIRNAIDMLDWGGTCTLLGVPKLGTEATFVVNTMYNDKSILGCRYGATRPHHDIPLLVRFYQDGRLQLDEMVSQTYPLADIQLALDDMHAGKLNRGVLSLT